jgi:NhaP-type Na+/H+ or K+/H+ antiporter
MVGPALRSPQGDVRRSRLAGLARLARLALTGLLVGAVIGFLGALLRPRTWVEYAEPAQGSRT